MRGGKTTAKGNRPLQAEAGAAAPPSKHPHIAESDIIQGLAKIAADESAPVTARVSAYGLLGKHFGLFLTPGDQAPSDLEALIRELAERDGRNTRVLPRTDGGSGGDGR